ncbi:unnamed protein product [Ectocarpus sp. CCAP 1310/34]|nr:unnamed protein product [Ectocarpus sp. CCAP 1310/34]
MSKVIERARKRVTDKVSGPVYAGPGPGELSINNCAVRLQQKVMSILRTLDSGVIALEPDVFLNGYWATQPDVHTRRRELLTDLLHEHLLTHNQITSADTVQVYRKTGEVVDTPRDSATATDWLRLIVREHALTGGAVEYANASLQAMVLGAPESMPTAAARMIALFERVTEVLLPNPVDRAGVNGLLHERIHSVSTTLQKWRQESHHPMGDHMSHRGKVAEGLFRESVAVLSARSEPYMTPPTPRKPNRAGGQDRLCAANPTPRHMSMPEY